MRPGHYSLLSMGLILMNCDLGENESDELTNSLLDSVDAASICCGVHAGSEAKTRRTLEVAANKGVLIGAHPGLPDEGGRGNFLPDADEFRSLIEAQLTQFIQIADQIETWVSYVKLHGSLYHAIEKNEAYAEIYLDLLKSVGSGFDVISMAGGSFQVKAKAAGLKVWEEAFVDRAYRSDGTLVPRSESGAVLPPEKTLERLNTWLQEGLLETVDGDSISMHFDSLCVHSDSPEPELLLQRMKYLIG